MEKMTEAQRLLAAGDLEQAEAIYRELLDAQPENGEVLFMLAQVRQKQADLDEALLLLKKAENLEPFNPNICHARGVLHIDRKEPEAAGRAFQQALDINPEHAAARSGLAFIALAEGRLEAAEHAAEMVLSTEPENAQALTYKGTALLEQGKLEPALAALQEALRIEPESLTAQAQLGRAFLAAGNAGFAVQCFENALQRAPGSADLLEYLGRALQETGDIAASIEPLRESVARGRANPELYRAMAAAETAAGRPGQGEGLLRAALQMGEADATPRADLALPLAELLLARGAAEEALELLGVLKAAGISEEMLDILLSRALLLCGRGEEAVAAIRERADAGNASEASQLALVEMLEATGASAEAGAVLDQLLEVASPSDEVLFFQARRSQQAGDPAAIEQLEALVSGQGQGQIQRSKLSPKLHYAARRLLAETLHAAGRYPEAAGQFAAIAYRDAEVLRIDSDFADSQVDASSAMDRAVTGSWPCELPADEPAAPVFLIAWPGSGQERLLPALGTHSALQLVLDPSESQAQRRGHIDRPRGAEALAALDDTQAALRRSRYRKALTAIGVAPEGGTVLDGMWLTVEALPSVARLFPGARVVFLGRDPKDMAVAWMMGGYRQLDTMAVAYGRQLALLERCRKSLPLRFVDVDYDELDADPQAVLTALQRALGLDPEPGVSERFTDLELTVPVRRGDHRHYAASPEASAAGPESDAIH